jgi:UDP-N-acetylglucosamine 1-carboxyvinyltransferase
VETDRFVVRPSGPLEGTVRIGGAKNSVLKLMAATVLAQGEFTLHNVPRIADVEIMCDLLVAMGIDSTRDGNTLRVRRTSDVTPEAPYELVEQMRASVVVIGPLLAACGRAKVSMPGGDNFGPRAIDYHLQGLEMLGAELDTAHGYIEARAEQLNGTRIVLEFPSHTATDTIMMAAVLAKGHTTIENAAREPEVADLASFLNRMGARIVGAGSSTIEIEGVESLHPCEHTVIPDRIEAATFMAAVGVAGGEVTIEGARPDHMDMVIQKVGDMGLRVAPSSSGLWAARPKDRLRSSDVATLPYPGIATDYKPLLLTMLTLADGVAIVTENIFKDNRFAYVSELARMGADIRTEGHHAVVRGVERLSGAPVKAADLRAGAALMLAGMAAEGETIISGAHHVDRGYDDLGGKLRSLGADVTRVREA